MRYRGILVFALLGLLQLLPARAIEITASASGELIRVRVAGAEAAFRVLALPLAGDDGAVEVCRGVAESAEFPRMRDKADLLYRRFVAQDAASGRVLAGPVYVTQFFGIDRPSETLIGKNGKKGLCCVVSMEEAAELGVRHLAVNITLNRLINWRATKGEIAHSVDGRRVVMNTGGVRSLDRQLQQARDLGMSVTGVFYNAFSRDEAPDCPLIHPGTDRAGSPTGVGAFNTATPEGVVFVRAALEFLAERYARPGGEFGQLHGIVVGNEVQSHWAWNNQGNVPREQVLSDYHTAVRIADLATRSRHANFRVYVSMDHHWAGRHLPDPEKCMSGREFFEGFSALGKAQGDFPWALAFHPYPENLFEPDFWNDEHCTPSADTPKISFRNVEVLTAFLARPEHLYKATSRRLAFTEQGFNFLSRRPDAGEVQAVAYARAFRKVMAMPEVDTFLYHRHADARGEGGLLLGLRGEEASTKGQRPIWNVFRQAGTPGQQAAFDAAEKAYEERKRP